MCPAVICVQFIKDNIGPQAKPKNKAKPNPAGRETISQEFMDKLDRYESENENTPRP